MSTLPGCLSRRSTETSEADSAPSGTPLAFLRLSSVLLEEASRRQADRHTQKASHQHIRPEVNPEIDARQGDHACKEKEWSSEPRVKHPDGGRGRKGGRGMARGKRRGVRERDERLDRRIGERRPGAIGEELQHYGQAFGNRRSSGGGERRRREPALGGVAAASGQREERPLDPPRRRKHEDRGEGPPMSSVQPLERSAVPLGELTEKLGQDQHGSCER
jgi:hypothetical protein